MVGPLACTSPSLLGPAVVAAGISGFIAIIGFVITTRNAQRLHREKLIVDRDLAERKISADINLAERKFTYDREFNDHKRRVELAEQVLAGFLQMRDVMREVRSPASFGNEGEDRPKWWQDESEPQARSRRVFFVPISRLLAHSDFINALMAKRYQMNAYFGPEAEGPFNIIRDVLAQIQSSARMMMMSVAVDGSRQGGIDLWRQWESAIWAGSEEPDPHAVTVEEALAAMALICRPVLTGKGG